jgi:hypothetical protein
MNVSGRIVLSRLPMVAAGEAREGRVEEVRADSGLRAYIGCEWNASSIQAWRDICMSRAPSKLQPYARIPLARVA